MVDEILNLTLVHISEDQNGRPSVNRLLNFRLCRNFRRNPMRVADSLSGAADCRRQAAGNRSMI